LNSDEPLLGDTGTMRNGAVLLLVERLGSILLPLLIHLFIKGEVFPIALSEVEVEIEVDIKAEAAALALALAMLTVHIFLIIFTAATPLDTLRAAYNQ
jgi:hypothetical protein